MYHRGTQNDVDEFIGDLGKCRILLDQQSQSNHDTALRYQSTCCVSPDFTHAASSSQVHTQEFTQGPQHHIKQNQDIIIPQNKNIQMPSADGEEKDRDQLFSVTLQNGEDFFTVDIKIYHHKTHKHHRQQFVHFQKPRNTKINSKH